MILRISDIGIVSVFGFHIFHLFRLVRCLKLFLEQSYHPDFSQSS